MNNQPSASEPNGRTNNGQFAKGNRFSKGNPHARRVQKLRSALLKNVTPNDLAEVVKSLVEAAKDGDVQAAKLLFDRCIGKAEPNAATAELQSGDDPTQPALTRAARLAQKRGFRIEGGRIVKS